MARTTDLNFSFPVSGNPSARNNIFLFSDPYPLNETLSTIGLAVLKDGLTVIGIGMGVITVLFTSSVIVMVVFPAAIPFTLPELIFTCAMLVFAETKEK